MFNFYIESNSEAIRKVKELILLNKLVTWTKIAPIIVDIKNFPNPADRLIIMNNFTFLQIPRNPEYQFFGQLLIPKKLKTLKSTLIIATCNPGGSTNLTRLHQSWDEFPQKLNITFEIRDNDYLGTLFADKP